MHTYVYGQGHPPKIQMGILLEIILYTYVL